MVSLVLSSIARLFAPSDPRTITERCSGAGQSKPATMGGGPALQAVIAGAIVKPAVCAMLARNGIPEIMRPLWVVWLVGLLRFVTRAS